MTPDEVRRLDNKDAIVLIRGEKPVIDEKYDILKHPNIHRTEDGGAPPYLHTPLRAFAADDLSFPIENIDDIEILEEFTWQRKGWGFTASPSGSTMKKS